MWAFLSVGASATALALIYNLACAAVGLALCRALLGVQWGTAFASALSAPILCAIMGQAIYGAVWQSLASVGWFRADVLLGALGIGVGAGIMAWLVRPQKAAPMVSRPASAPAPADMAILSAALLVCIACTWVRSFGWPDGDAMAFYLAQPKLIAYTGSITPLADYESFAQIGLFAEMHVAAMYLADGELAARSWLWQAGVLLIGALAAVCRELGIPRGGALLAAAVVLTSSAITNVMMDGKVDHVAALWAMGALLLGVRIPVSNALRWSFAAGLLGTLACLSKLSFVVGFPLILIMLVTVRLIASNTDVGRIARAARVLAAAAAATLGASLAAATLVLKNHLVFAEPLAPFLLSGGNTAGMLNQVWFSPDNTRWILESYPIALTFGKFPMQHGNISPLLLGFVPLLALAWRQGMRVSRDTLIVAGGGLAAIGAWMLLRPAVLAPRYIFPHLLCLAPPLLQGADFWLRRVSWIPRYLVLAAICAQLFVTGHRALGNWPMTRAYAMDEKPDALLIGSARLAEAAAPGARFLIASYYKMFLPPQVMLCTVGAATQALLAASPPTSPQAMWEKLYRNGITDILIYRGTHVTLLGQPTTIGQAPPWLSVAEEIYSPIVSVIRLRALDGAPPPGPRCNRQ